jgi:hypothetical protein
MANVLDVVPIRIEDEGPVVVGMVVGAQAGLSVVCCASRKGGGVNASTTDLSGVANAMWAPVCGVSLRPIQK